MWFSSVLLLVSTFWVPLAVAQQFPPSASPCGNNLGGCDKVKGLCWGTSETTHYCSCKAGYKQDERSLKHKCIDINECVEGNSCPTNSICENKDGSFRCHCLCGYIKDYTGEHCLLATQIQGICSLPTRCVSLSGKLPRTVSFRVHVDNHDYVTRTASTRTLRRLRSRNSATCDCEIGFRRNSCGFCEDIDECEEGTHACRGPGASCRNIEGTYYCECQSPFKLCVRRCYGPKEQVPDSCEVPEDIKGNAVTEATSEPLPLVCRSRQNVGSEFADLDEDGTADTFIAMICDGMGRSQMERSVETEAQWGEWTCWSACKPTCWGGLQTRSRRCKHGVVGVGCTGKASESKECYSGAKCPFRIRKDATKLTGEEISDLVQAMEKFKKDTSVYGFHNTASSHGWPFQCNNLECCPHGAKMKFLAWHRSTMLNYEKGLARHLRDKTLGLPYWNWLSEDRNPPTVAWSKEIRGRPNPFTNMTVRIDLEGPMTTIQRDSAVDMATMNMTYDEWIRVTESLMKPNTMHEFSESLESIHGDPHVAICRSSDCEISMGSLLFAGFDPIFMFHHTQIDRLWAVFQKKLDDDGATAWTVDTAIELGEPISDFGRPHMPFGNDTINPYPIMKAVNNMRDSYYYKELMGVVYDFLDNNGFPPEEKETKHKFQNILIAHYLRSFNGSNPIYVNYYEAFPDARCDQLKEEIRLGGDIMLPTKQTFRNAVPTLISAKLVRELSMLEYIFVTDKQKNNDGDFRLVRDGLKPSSDISVKACYTNQPQCRSECSEASNNVFRRMTSPGLLQREENSDLEVFKFNWSPGNIMPYWHINFKTETDFIYFYGSRASHIYQVSTASEWQDCDLSTAKPLHCPPRTRCMLPVGIYYIVDQDPRLCQEGLRMVAMSRN